MKRNFLIKDSAEVEGCTQLERDMVDTAWYLCQMFGERVYHNDNRAMPSSEFQYKNDDGIQIRATTTTHGMSGSEQLWFKALSSGHTVWEAHVGTRPGQPVTVTTTTNTHSEKLRQAMEIPVKTRADLIEL